ncbi:MAG: FIST C-terminal domain-containing protein [SAR324 cluster bacterium]|nr:FIST C-terminal domain-containing protein [SAR324 cluster bacterium]
MIKVGVGLSQQEDSAAAASDAAEEALTNAQLQKADWVLVFISTSHIPQADLIRKTLIEKTQCLQLAGCSGAGVLTDQNEIVGETGLAVMVGASPEIQSKAFIHRQEDPDFPSIPQQLSETLEAFEGSAPMVFLFPDAYSSLPYNLINTLNYVSTNPLSFGGGACDDGSRQRSVEIGPNAAFSDAVSGLCLGGVKHHAIGVTQSCTPIAEPLFITSVEENVIVTLDGYPALEVFSTLAANQGLNSIEAAAQQILIAFPLDKENPDFTGEACLVRHLAEVDVSRQGLIVPQLVEEGGVLSLMNRNAVTAENDLYTMLDRLKTSNSETPAFGIYFNCAARGESLYGRPNVDTEAIRETLGAFPIIGFMGGFEMASVPAGLQLYSYTGVLVLFYDPSE